MTSASVSSLPLNGTFPPYYPIYQDCFGTLDWWATSRNVRMFERRREWHIFFLYQGRPICNPLRLIAGKYVFEFLFDSAGGWYLPTVWCTARLMELHALGLRLRMHPGIPFFAWHPPLGLPLWEIPKRFYMEPYHTYHASPFQKGRTNSHPENHYYHHCCFLLLFYYFSVWLDTEVLLDLSFVLF